MKAFGVTHLSSACTKEKVELQVRRVMPTMRVAGMRVVLVSVDRVNLVSRRNALVNQNGSKCRCHHCVAAGDQLESADRRP